MLATLSIACATAVAAPDDPRHAPGQAQWYVVDLLDPEHPAEQRQRLLENLYQEAESGDPQAAILLGHLYFLGPQHPSGLLDRLPDLAERYFRMALDAGDPAALTALAEVALARGNPGEALVWVQAHLVFQEHIGKPDGQASYAVALLARAQRGGRRAIGRDTLVERVQAIMDSHGARMLAHDDNRTRTTLTGMAWTPGAVPPECSVYEHDADRLTLRRSTRSRLTSRFAGGFAHYLASISPQGEIVDLVMVSSMPNAAFADDMATSVRQNVVFKEVDDACPLRWVRMPMDSSDFQSRLR